MVFYFSPTGSDCRCCPIPSPSPSVSPCPQPSGPDKSNVRAYTQDGHLVWWATTVIHELAAFVDVSPDRKYAYVGGNNGDLTKYVALTGEELWQVTPGGQGRALAVSPITGEIYWYTNDVLNRYSDGGVLLTTGDSHAFPQYAVVDPSDGDVFICGGGNTANTTGNVAKYDSITCRRVESAFQRWFTDSPEEDNAFQVDINSSGDIVVAVKEGTVFPNVSFRGGLEKISGTVAKTLWEAAFYDAAEGSAAIFDSNDDVLGIVRPSSGRRQLEKRAGGDGDLVWTTADSLRGKLHIDYVDDNIYASSGPRRYRNSDGTRLWRRSHGGNDIAMSEYWIIQVGAYETTPKANDTFG